MKIKDMFAKKIDREIQGVIIVGQGEDANVSQELEEYVVTRELQKHFADFYSAYKKGIVGTTPKMGVWISGFFGSGKSHFLKILSYLLENRQVETNRILGGLRKEREQTEKAWKEKEALEEKMGQIHHKLDLLQELEGLFRGKKFVEYVARYYMEYVSREADEKLKEMTGNSLGLETDQSGMFIIRDYKNGGATRPASTLSGGETFMASLALALALSSQIQMKGAAPMELFFLDEGFGTLDEKYLEIVMEALEKIRDRKRSVGVISHVEEIKARIPVRLIVEPSRAGEGGSKIHIERE